MADASGMETVLFYDPSGRRRCKRVELMKEGEWREANPVLASGVVEGAARYVVGERLDQSGMRWIVHSAEAVLLLRRIEVNGDQDAFFAFSEEQRRAEPSQAKAARIRSRQPIQLPDKAEEARRHKAKAA